MKDEMTDQEFDYIIKRLRETYDIHKYYQKLFKGQTGRRWVPEIRIFPPDTGIKTHLQKDEGG